MTWTTRTVRDALVQIDDISQWVRVSAVEALSVSLNTGNSIIYLSSGQTIITTIPVDEIIDKMSKAMRPPGPVTIPPPD